MQKFLQRHRVGKRMITSFSVLLTFIVFIALLSAYSLMSMRKQLDELADVRSVKYGLSVELNESASQIYMDLQALLLSPDAERRSFLLDRMANSRTEVAKTLDELEMMASSDTDRQLLAKVRDHGKQSTAINQTIAQLRIDGELDQAIVMMRHEGAPALDTLNDAIDAIRHHEGELTAQSQLEAAAVLRTAMISLLLSVLAAITIGLFLAVAITRSLTQPLARAAQAARELAQGKLDGIALQAGNDETGDVLRAIDTTRQVVRTLSNDIVGMSAAALKGDFTTRTDEEQYQHGYRDMVVNLNQLMATTDQNLRAISAVLQAIAAGDLTQRMEGQYQGVFAIMRDDANTTVTNLTGIVGRIQQAAGLINDAASEIASGNADLSRRTESQAANLEETAASMEELTATVRQNNDHARHANQLAITASTVAAAGGQAVGEVVHTMSDIEKASRRIADIITVIDSIAFQTNILALNAAVEAARAGEQGRGFAVVASEVRTLAQRSAAAAKEIKTLIDDSVEKVAQGSDQVGKAGNTMGEIVTSVQRVTEIMAEISAASSEQTAGIEQVNQTVVQMDEVTQQNASLVEEASAATRALADQAQHLVDAAASFRLRPGSVTEMRQRPNAPSQEADPAIETATIQVRRPSKAAFATPRTAEGQEKDWNTF